jgi:hypothetical protein
MESNLNLLIKKLWNAEHSTVKFIEQYYSNKLGAKLIIELDDHADTSYYDTNKNRVAISSKNLIELFQYYPNVGYKVYYTLMLHEIGHAIYTNKNLLSYYNDFLNILEDNRLEFQISIWNNRVKFDLLRYALQDKRLNDNYMVERSIQNPTMIGLGLLRTVDNSNYVKFYSDTQERADMVREILKLNSRYMMNDTFSKDFTTDTISDMVLISQRVRELCNQLAILKANDKSAQQKQNSNQKQQQGSSGQSSQPQKQDSSDSQQDGEKKITQANSTNGSSQEKEGTPSEKTKPSPSDNSSKKQVDVQALEQELKDLQVENIKERQRVNNGIGTLLNPNPLQEPYTKININAFTTMRRSGIKGSRDVSRTSGTAKQLSLRKYARRGFVKNEKPFDKPLEVLGKGGKSAKITFYLDISGSMSGDSLKISTAYLKSFYDLMSKHIDIRLMAFGSHTYEITRKELELKFLEPRLEGTRPPVLVKASRGEKIVILTDGQWPGSIPSEHAKNSNFVLIEPDIKIVEWFKRQGVRNLITVSQSNIKKGLDKATDFIRDLLN